MRATAEPGRARRLRVLVTGTSGFIGGHVAEWLSRSGHLTFGLDRLPPARELAGVQTRICDLTRRDSVAELLGTIAPDAIVHLAARTDLDDRAGLAGYTANTTGVENLLAAIAATPSVRRAICTSSQLVCRVGWVPAHDDDYQPNTAYGESKVLTEQLWKGADGAGREWCIVRPTTIWGPGMNPHYLRFFALIRDGRYFHVGAGPTFKSYGFVGNTAFQLERLLEAPTERMNRRTFYLADYEPLALEDWAEAFRQTLGASRIRTLPRPLARAAALLGDGLNHAGLPSFPFNSFRLRNVLTSYRFDLSATRDVCGPLPYTVTEGVRLTTEWLRRVWSRPELDPRALALPLCQPVEARIA